jgi:branched-chain amino acid transport system substrate-binding protein
VPSMRLKSAVGAAVLAVSLAACSSSGGSNSSSAPPAGGTAGGSGGGAAGVTSTSIKIGLITDQTGPLSSSFNTTAKGVQGYFNMVNAKGGVNGRKLNLVTADDASTAQQGLTAAQSLVSQGVFAIINISAASPSGSYRYMQQQGIPVVGSCYDGPEWSNPANNNMFSWNGCNGKAPGTTTLGAFFKEKGVSKLGVLAYGGVPSSAANSLNYASAAKSVGIPTVYKGLSVGLTQVNFSPEALAIKSSGADAIAASMGQATDLGISTALANIGYHPLQLYAGVGYDPATLKDPTTKSAAQDDYFTVQFRPVETDTPAAQAFSKNFEQYAGISGVPPFGAGTGWFGASLLVAGLQKIGSGELTRQSYITAMHALSGFDADGMLASPIDFSKRWGQGAFGLDPNNCAFVVQLKGDKFVPQNNGDAYCGKVIPGSNQTPDNPAVDPT